MTISEDITDYCKCCTGAIIGGLGTILLIAFALSGFAIGIANIVIGATWNNCYLNDDYVHIYLIVYGSLMLASAIFFHDNLKEDAPNLYAIGSVCAFACLGVVAWGTSIMWDTKQGDCDHGQYDYALYMTLALCFFNVAIISIGILGVILYGCFAGATAAMDS
jgi:hypothetical protein